MSGELHEHKIGDVNANDSSDESDEYVDAEITLSTQEDSKESQEISDEYQQALLYPAAEVGEENKATSTTQKLDDKFRSDSDSPSVFEENSAMKCLSKWHNLRINIIKHLFSAEYGNLEDICQRLLCEGIVQGRFIFCHVVIHAQHQYHQETDIFAAVVAGINDLHPNIGELLLKRLILRFNSALRGKKMTICQSALKFIAHLMDHQVVHNIIAIEIMTRLVDLHRYYSLELLKSFVLQCGRRDCEIYIKGLRIILNKLRALLHEKTISLRTRYLIESFMLQRIIHLPEGNLHLSDYPQRKTTHILLLDGTTKRGDAWLIFKNRFKSIDDDLRSETSTESVKDEISTIYDIVNSGRSFEDCFEQLLQHEPHSMVCHIILDCAGVHETYSNFYANLAYELCALSGSYRTSFEKLFELHCRIEHNLNSHRWLHTAIFFAVLLSTDSISWRVLSSIDMQEEELSEAKRSYLCRIFQYLASYMEPRDLKKKLIPQFLNGLFCGENTNKAFDFFNSIGLAVISLELSSFIRRTDIPLEDFAEPGGIGAQQVACLPLVNGIY